MLIHSFASSSTALQGEGLHKIGDYPRVKYSHARPQDLIQALFQVSPGVHVVVVVVIVVVDVDVVDNVDHGGEGGGEEAQEAEYVEGVGLAVVVVPPPQ